MDFLYAETQASRLIDEVKDKRLKKGLKNVAEACKELIKNNKKLTYKEVGTYCVKKFNSPSKGAFDNGSPSSKKYKALIGVYRSLLSTEKVIKTDTFSTLPIGVKSYISQIEQRNRLLENVIKELDRNSLKNEVISLTETIKGHDFKSDTAKTVFAKDLLSEDNKKSLRILLYDLPEYANEELELQGEGEMARLISKSTGMTLLNPRQYSGLVNLLSNTHTISKEN